MTTNPEVLRLAVYHAAVEYCGEKDRETSLDDIRYFERNWWCFPGFKERVERHLRQSEKDNSDAD